ncbi:hypothetical protein MAM1_0153c06731 [Mucor ambiguus]|uniref:Uncharacterized protein n=1 Tax=Mucor ambiguus TaxID=91626 RepID=A0A0C9MYE5_9FUNG|nr:hypothetical protein MAM1_0153c06731 [Mucor ambiguus]
MAFPHSQSGLLNALQSGLDDSVDFNQFDEDYTNVSDQVYLPNAIDEEYMANDWSVNQDPDPTYATFSGEAYSEDIIIYNQLSTHELATNIPLIVEPSYSSGFVQELCRSVRHVNEGFLANAAAMQSNAQQLPFSSVINYSACVSEAATDNEQETEQARHKQLPMDEDVPLNYFQLHPNEIELIELEEIQRITGSAFNDEDYISSIFGNSHHDLLDKDEDRASMSDDDDDGKDFSSWLLYDSDDNIATFKIVLSENTSGDKSLSTADAHAENSSIAKPIANLHDDSHVKGSKGHAVPGSESQANRASLGEKSKSDIANISGKEVVHQSNTRPFSNLDHKQCTSSPEQPRRHSPILYTSSLSEAGSSFQDAIVRTSTPNNSTRHSIDVGDQVPRELSPIKKTEGSKYFLCKNRNAPDVRGGARPL